MNFFFVGQENYANSLLNVFRTNNRSVSFAKWGKNFYTDLKFFSTLLVNAGAVLNFKL